MEIRQYFEVLRRRAWIVALLTVVAVGAVIFQVIGLAPRYEADVSLLVTPRVTAPTAFEDPPSAFLGPYRQAVLRNVALLIQSREVLQRAAEKLDVPTAEQLRRRIEVTEDRDSDFLLIKGRHDLPDRAALIANTVAEEFVNFYVDINRAEARQSQKFVEGELRRSGDRLGNAERELLQFKARNGAATLTGESSRMAQRLLAAQSAYETAILEETIARSRLNAIQRRLQSQEDPRLATVTIATNPVVAQLRTHLTTLELELAALRQINTDQHPKVQELLGKVVDARQRLGAEGLKIVKDESMGVSPIREQFVREMVTAEVDGVVARAKAAAIQDQLRKIDAASKSILPQNELTLARLERGVKVAEEVYLRLSTLHQESVIRENSAASSGQAAIVVVDRAIAPEQPVSNQLPLKAGLGGMVALVLGAALALLVDSMDDRIRSSGQAEGAYGVPVLAAIPVISPQTQRVLMASPTTATLLLSVIVVLLGFAAVFVGLTTGASFSLSYMKTAPDNLLHSAQVLFQMLPTIP